MPKIVVVGSLNMDLVVRIPQIPKPGETLLGGEFKTFPGGKGANQAVAAARLGAAVSMIGCVGDDAFGQELRNTLIKEGIDTTPVVVHPEAATGVALIQVDKKGGEQHCCSVWRELSTDSLRCRKGFKIHSRF